MVPEHIESDRGKAPRSTFEVRFAFVNNRMVIGNAVNKSMQFDAVRDITFIQLAWISFYEVSKQVSQ
jgi:hypothetical protein